jgi:hypothetical protein
MDPESRWHLLARAADHAQQDHAGVGARRTTETDIDRSADAILRIIDRVSATA